MNKTNIEVMKPLKIFINILTAVSIVYWLSLTFIGPENTLYYDIFGMLLALLPLLGFIIGIFLSKQWGGFSSLVGKSIVFLSTALLMWFFGQTAFQLYISLTGDVPYPGIPDYFFVLIDPFYALSMLFIMKYTGAFERLKKPSAYILNLVIPLIAIYINYVLFFGGEAIFTPYNSETLFDLIYTFGSTSIMALVALTIILSINKLGGRMRKAVYLIFIGTILQYLGDISYSIAELNDAVYSGIPADFIFFLSITFIIQGIMNLNPAKLMPKQTENVE